MMKKIFAALLALLMILSLAACGGSSVSVEATAAETAKAWMNEQIKNNTLVSFTYDGKAYADHIKDWNKTVKETDDGWDVAYEKDGLALAIDITYNEKHASLEWVGQWSNNGSGNSKVIADILMLDSDFAVADATMTTAVCGGQNDIADFQPESAKLEDGKAVRKSNTGGRSTQNAWPYFDLVDAEGTHGIMMAIGWTGNWKSGFIKNGDIVRVEAGMQTTNYYMEAGESLRTPRIVLQFFKGDQDAGHNAWRQLVLEEYSPTDIHTGENMRHAFITINTWGGRGSDSLLDTMNQAKASGQYFEYQWIDAGWYGDHVFESTYDPYWRTNLGNWYYNPGYPNGFKDIDAWHEENGTGFLVWFEPGRVTKGTDLPTEHPEFFLPESENNKTSFLHFDFGNTEACDYMIDLVIGFLDDMGCDFYRQDYNFDPAKSWSEKDRVLDANGNRTGVSEIMYVTGHYRYLDAILASGRMFDNCASGGRLLDIEMTKRGIPLWRTDYTVSGQDVQTVASGIRSQGASLSWWLPLHGGNTSSEGNNTEYLFRSYMATGATLGVLGDQKFAEKMIGEMVYNREMMMGDYYILQQGLGGDTDAVNAGYEFYRPDLGQGFLVCFRPTYSSEEYTTFILKGLDAGATYEVRNADNDQKLTMTGEELMSDGIKAFFPRNQIAHMIYITKQ